MTNATVETTTKSEVLQTRTVDGYTVTIERGEGNTWVKIGNMGVFLAPSNRYTASFEDQDNFVTIRNTKDKTYAGIVGINGIISQLHFAYTWGKLGFKEIEIKS